MFRLDLKHYILLQYVWKTLLWQKPVEDANMKKRLNKYLNSRKFEKSLRKSLPHFSTQCALSMTRCVNKVWYLSCLNSLNVYFFLYIKKRTITMGITVYIYSEEIVPSISYFNRLIRYLDTGRSCFGICGTFEIYRSSFNL